MKIILSNTFKNYLKQVDAVSPRNLYFTVNTDCSAKLYPDISKKVY